MKLRVRAGRFYKKKAELAAHINEIVDSYGMPVTVRQVFYRLVALGFIKNKKNTYRLVSEIISDGRYYGVIDWDLIEDETKHIYATTAWENVDSIIEAALNTYRNDRWRDSEFHVELWTEKRTLTRLLGGIADKYDIPLVAGTGIASTSQLWGAYRRLENVDKTIVILTVGDLDPTGDWIPENAENGLRELLPGKSIVMYHVALDMSQVTKYGLPGSYDTPKLNNDSRKHRFIEKYGSLFQVEVEALEPPVLVRLVEDAVKEYYPAESAEKIKRKERRDVNAFRRRLVT